MSEENQEQPQVETDNTQTESNDSFTLDEIEKLNREIEESKKKFVSEDVEKKIAAERASAKKEAEKEFLVNQRVKELEKEKEELRQKNEDSQRRAAEQLEALKAQVDKLMASKASVQIDNPFKKPSEPQVEQGGLDYKKLREEDILSIEEASFQAFLDQKSKN